MARPPRLDDEHRRAVLALHRAGWRQDRLARLFAVSPDTIRRAILDAYLEAGRLRRQDATIPETSRS